MCLALVSHSLPRMSVQLVSAYLNPMGSNTPVPGGFRRVRCGVVEHVEITACAVLCVEKWGRAADRLVSLLSVKSLGIKRDLLERTNLPKPAKTFVVHVYCPEGRSAWGLFVLYAERGATGNRPPGKYNFFVFVC